LARQFDHLIDCTHDDCRFPNRAGAVFCAQCGRELVVPEALPLDAAATIPASGGGFLTARGGPVTRLDHLGAALSWCLAFAGLAILVASFGRIVARVAGI